MMITIWWLLYDDCYVMITILWYHLSTRQISKKQADRWDIHRRSLPLMFQECTAESACRSPGGTAPFWWGSNTSGRGCPGVWQNCGIRGIYIYYYILYIYYYMIYIYISYIYTIYSYTIIWYNEKSIWKGSRSAQRIALQNITMIAKQQDLYPLVN